MNESRGLTGDGRRRMAVLAVAALVLAAAPGAAPLLAQERRGARVDSMVAEGRLQEAAWAARADGDHARAEALLARLERILLSAPRSARPLGVDSQGVSYTFRLDHGEGVGSIFKVDGSDIFCRECGAEREVASYRVDRLLGLDLTPLTVRSGIVDDFGDTLAGSAMYFVHDGRESRDVGATKPDLLRFFDAVIGNSDRHAGNWLILPDGRVVAIDHNRAFQYRPVSAPKTCWETELDSIREPTELGPAFDRYRQMSDDSLAAALAGLDSSLVHDFLGMRPRVVDRILARTADPVTIPARTDCVFDD